MNYPFERKFIKWHVVILKRLRCNHSSGNHDSGLNLAERLLHFSPSPSESFIRPHHVPAEEVAFIWPELQWYVAESEEHEFTHGVVCASL